MSKINDVIYSYAESESLDTGVPYSSVQFSCDEVESMMKEYAEWYAKKCLEIAVDNAETYTDRGGYTFVDGKSILNIKLPDHDKTL